MKLATLLVSVLLIASPTRTCFRMRPHKQISSGSRRSAEVTGERSERLATRRRRVGGHRGNAMQHIDMALREPNEAEKFAREHHKMK